MEQLKNTSISDNHPGVVRWRHCEHKQVGPGHVKSENILNYENVGALCQPKLPDEEGHFICRDNDQVEDKKRCKVKKCNPQASNVLTKPEKKHHCGHIKQGVGQE